MKRIVYTRADGGVSIVHPAPNARKVDETEEEFLNRVISTSVPSGVEFKIVDEHDIPTDRTFRNAWCGLDCGVDMTKARPIHMDRIRKVRDQVLKKLDVEYQRADEKEDLTAKRVIANTKQKLRDIPQTFDLTTASTPEELQNLWPEILPK